MEVMKRTVKKNYEVIQVSKDQNYRLANLCDTQAIGLAVRVVGAGDRRPPGHPLGSRIGRRAGAFDTRNGGLPAVGNFAVSCGA